MLMEVSSLLSLPEGLRIESIQLQGTRLLMGVVAVCPFSRCPLCAEVASQIHSQYQRTLHDVPCGGRKVVLRLSVRKFFCRNPSCARKIFTERLPTFVEPWARVTLRLAEAVEAIGLATSGELGTRLADRIGFHASPSTVLRRIMDVPTDVSSQVSYLGIDDWSFRRGRKFGTLLVDLTSHAIVDLLPDRSADTSAAWMRAHPEIEVVSRDRGGDYASAAVSGAPQAIQCADRFHILKNLREALEGLLARHLAAKRKEKTQKTLDGHLPIWQASRSARRSPRLERLQQARREERLARYEQVIALRKQGRSYEAIAQQLGMGASTVQSWLAVGAFPERKPREQATRLDRYLPYLFERWESGCHNMAGLFRELQDLGYKGSYASVRDHIVRQLPEGKKGAAKGDMPPRAPVLSRQAAFLFLRRPKNLDTLEQETVLMLRQYHPEVELAYDLVQQFAQMLRTRTGEHLDTWLTEVSESQITELQDFALGIEHDKAAVKAGLTLPHSNGIVEGKVNKLKLIKRMGYGRAEFPLLRQRVLHAL